MNFPELFLVEPKVLEFYLQYNELKGAVCARDTSKVFELIEAGADVNTTDYNERKTALFYAVQVRDNESVVRALLDAGADVNRTDNEGKTALFYAVRVRDNESVVRVLLDGGADVNRTDNDGRTALFYVGEAGANVNSTDVKGMTPLFYTSASQNAVAVCKTLIDAKADVNIADKRSQTPLFYAVGHRNPGLISELIRAGADINIRDNEKETALFSIITDVNHFFYIGSRSKILVQLKEGADFIEAGNNFYYYGSDSTFNEILQALLIAGVDINSTNISGQSALSKAVEFGDYRSVCALIKAGANLEIKDLSGRTALFKALRWCYSGDYRFLDALIEARADVNAQNSQGQTPLFWAVNKSFDFSLAQKLIDAGADVNKTDNGKRTALFYVVPPRREREKYSNFSHMIDGLLEAGLDVNSVDKEGKTVLHWAAIGDDVELTQKCISAGVRTNIPDKQGRTALFYTVMPQYIIPREDDNEALIFGESMIAETEKETIARALVEDGKASVNARDTMGRTPLFHAVQISMPMTTYFIENGANLLIRDNCGVDVLSILIERCVVNRFEGRVQPSLPGDMYEVLDLFLKHGITKNAVFKAIINVVFCQTLLVASYIPSDPRNQIKHLFNILELARRQYLDETQNDKKEIIDNILAKVQSETRDVRTFYKFLVPNILSQLIELGANPNSADRNGNTALHLVSLLPLYGMSREIVMKICHQLDNFGVIFNIRNHERETPLLFCLSPSNHPRYCWKDDRVSKLGELRYVFTFFLQYGSCADEATSSGNSIFHLLLELFQELYKKGASKQGKEEEEKEVEILLSLFGEKLYANKETVNRRQSDKLNTSLHIWATLRVNDPFDEDVLKRVLNYLLEYGADLNIINEDGKTPLHVCSSWTAVMLLLDAGANPSVRDSLGRSPLTAATEAAQKLPHFLEENHLYFDLLLEPHEFWRSAVEKGLDPWAVDKRGESVLSFLIKSDQFVLAEALVEVARDDKHLQSKAIAASLLNTICKDRSTRAHWKSNLVEMILKDSGSMVFGQNNETTPLHFCCLNIVDNSKRNGVSTSEGSDKEVFLTIAEQLVLHGADYTIPDSTGKSCLDIAKTNPELRDLLTKPRDIKEVPLLIPWTANSETYKDRLAKVARRLESRYSKPFWYHRDHVASGSFGAVFAGINGKDGREVAIKRIEKIRMNRPEDNREITNLTSLADCEQVVRYLSFFEDEDFCHVVMELMEGNLDDYFNSTYFDKEKGVVLCKNVTCGLKYLHSHDILHRDIKPGNILYKCHPELCLKIADFGLSRRIDCTSTTVYGTNVGTRCWIAPEVLKSTKASEQHSKQSDIFSSGLVLHYILSVKKHPFAPVDCTSKSEVQISHETEANVINGNMEGWDDSLFPEAAHLLKAMLDGDKKKRPSAGEALDHPFFWTKKKKLDLLTAVGNQPEIECPSAKRTPPLTAVETDLETSFGTIVRYADWNDPRYLQMPVIYPEMTTKRKRYDTHTVVELVRFIRNAIAHVSDGTRPPPIRKQILDDFVFLEYFPNLVMEVYKAVTTHGWDQTREEIKYVIMK